VLAARLARVSDGVRAGHQSAGLRLHLEAGLAELVPSDEKIGRADGLVVLGHGYVDIGNTASAAPQSRAARA